MIRQNIKLGPHTYIAELYKYYELSAEVTSTFSFLRNINFFNYVAIDNDIYIFDDKILNNRNIEDIKNIIYPITTTINQYSNNINDFTNIFKTYKILDKTFNPKTIRCDKIRIYHPLTKVHNENIIIDVNNLINGINFHYIISLYENCEINSKTEFKVYNDVYSEYIEFYIPCIEDVISTNTFFIEDTTSCNIDTKYIDTYVTSDENNRISNIPYNNLIQTDGVKTYCSTYLFNIPYSVENGKKVYLPEVEKSIENTYITYPITLVLYPFSEITDDGIYLCDNTLNANLDVFSSAPSFSLIGKLTFNEEDKLILKAIFNYPKTKVTENLTLQEAYEYYNNVKLENYDNIYYDNVAEYEESGDTLIGGDANIYKQYQCVYNITIASDPEFKNIIYTSPNYNNAIYSYAGDLELDTTNMNTLLNTVVNKEFYIPLFTSWDQLPETLICKLSFTDRYLGTYIESNFVIITKDYYKYLVNYEDDDIEIYKLTNLMDKVKFYDKIVCNVLINKGEKNTNINKNSNTNIIYKPIFYKTNDLQNIKIQSGVSQNIGINLSNYMSKVNTFYIVINGVKFIETGRNDIYVIFNVQANKLQNKTGGSYYVTNEDDEYISSGNWSII